MSYAGADYRKADLQIHSPRDHSWTGGRPDAQLGSAASEADIDKVRREWAKRFVEICIKSGIQLAALTDHHEGVYCWYVLDEVARRSSEENFNFWFMPGMELTCKDSAQAIILFDYDISKVLFEKARNLLNLPSNVEEYKQEGVRVEPLNINIEDIQSVLERDGELKNRFIILPNVTPGGYKSVIRNGFHKRFKDMPYIGGYLDKQWYDNLKEVDKKKLDGEIPAWSNEKRGVITTSDTRNALFDGFGQYATWLKVTLPKAESIRQAMLAASSRIIYKQPIHSDLYIESVSVTGAEFLKLNQVVYLSRQFTAVIGGRGSGKSTVLEYIRYALGISAMDIGSSSWDPTHSRRKELLHKTLKNSQVQVGLISDGVHVSLTRSTNSSDRVIMHINGNRQILSLEDTRLMFPVRAYSQGELSHLGDDKAESRLYDLVTASHRKGLDAVESEIVITSGLLKKQLNRLVELWKLEGEKRQADAQILTLNAGISKIKEDLSGLSEDTQKVLDEHQEIANTARWFEQVFGSYKDSIAVLSKAYEKHLQSSDYLIDATKIPANVAAQKLVLILRENHSFIAESFIRLVSENQKLEHQFRASEQSWLVEESEHTIRYNEAIEYSKIYTARIQRLGQLESQLSHELQKRDSVTNRIGDLLDAETEMFKVAGTFIGHQNELRRLSAESASQLEVLTNNQARAELLPEDDISEMEEALGALFYGSGVRANRIEDLVKKLKNSEGTMLENWWSLIDELIQILKWKITGLHETEQRPVLPILEPAIDRGGLQKFCDQLSVDRMLSIITSTIKPRVHLLQRRGEVEIEFSQASQGEKATILLNVLMRQPGGPLLLDQPEEDLDNRIVGEVVTAIHDAKISKQLLFATHNANLVVNGDAELVVALINGSIHEIGAIDLEPLRESITETMEGGKEAFELRRRKYNF